MTIIISNINMGTGIRELINIDRIESLTKIFILSNDVIAQKLPDIESLVFEISREGCREEKERLLGILNMVNMLIDKRNGVITVAQRIKFEIPNSNEDTNGEILDQKITQSFLSIIQKFTPVRE